jgi:hypothetical protein
MNIIETKKFVTGVVCLGVIALWGCASRVPLTKEIIKEYNLSGSDIKKLQLYVSGGILLEQEQTTIDKNVDFTCSLKKVEDRYIKRIFFKELPVWRHPWNRTGYPWPLSRRINLFLL